MRRRVTLASLLLVPASPATAEVVWGGGVVVGTPTGEFSRHVDVAGGLAGHALVRSAGSPAGLRLDGSWLLYGSETSRAPLARPLGRLATELTTDNWIGQFAAGPELRARAGRVRPYAQGFIGVSYVSTTTELSGPRPGFGPVTTNLDDTAFCYGGGAGVLVPLASGWAIDVGGRYASSSRARFLAEGDLGADGSFIPRRARTSRIEFWLGVASLGGRKPTTAGR
jgi:opacity protein-like surface antigen